MRRAALVLVVPVLLAARAAWPCSPVMPGLDGPALPDATTTVPRNSLIVLHPFAKPSGFTVTLIDDAGAETRPPVLDDGALIVVAPETLEPARQYTVRFALDEDAASFGESGRDDLVFTTNETIDDEPPVIDGELTAPTVEARPATSSFGMIDSCGFSNADHNIIVFALPDATDDHDIAGYRLLDVDERGGRSERDVVLAGERTTLVDDRPISSTVTYVVEVFDLAGNVSETAPLTVDLGVPFLGGCSAAGHATTGNAPTSALALAALLALRRRRR